MTPQDPHFRAPPIIKEVAARAVPREDARWVRPVFRPPPLSVNPAGPQLAYSDTIHRTELRAFLSGESAEAR
jgi:hypothetical protein